MAGFLSAIFGGNRAQAKQPSFSLEKLHQTYGRLKDFKESDLERHGGGDAIVEVVRQITEALVWGEQHDSSFFDFFCEHNIMEDFIRVLRLEKAPKAVKMQMLQTLSMLLQNIRRDQSLYYLLSSSKVNNLIKTPMDFSDEEILAYYITLLKSLAMRITPQTIGCFFLVDKVTEEPQFPLYTEATKFFNHRDQMVRATVRTITLRIYPLDNPAMQAFVQRHAEDFYFQSLAMHLHYIWLRLNSAACEDDTAAAQHENDLQQDLLIYMSDVFECGNEALNKILAERLLAVAIVPLLLLSLDGSAPASASEPAPGAKRLSPDVALFLLRQVLDTIRYPALIQLLAASLLHPKVPDALLPALPAEAPTQFHGRFVRYLQGGDDATFMFAAGLIGSCARHRAALAADFLEEARLCPSSSSSRRPLPHVSEENLDIVWYLLQAVQRKAEWRPEVFQVLLLVISDIFLVPLFFSNNDCRNATMRMLRVALAGAAKSFKDALLRTQPCTPEQDRWLDVFMEEWEAQSFPQPGVAQICTNSWRLLLPSAEGSTARGRGAALAPAAAGALGASAAEDYPRRVVRCFLSLRRLVAELTERAEAAMQDRPVRDDLGWRSERSPLQGSPDQLGDLREGSVVPVDQLERIACSVMLAAGGSQVRYLLAHRAWFLLARDEPSAPGSLLVTTRWPVQQVQGYIDRADPRILRLGLQGAVSDGRPGEAVELSTPSFLPDGLGRRSSAVFSLALAFEDVRLCRSADVQLKGMRREVRTYLLQKSADWAEECFLRASATAGAPL